MDKEQSEAVAEALLSPARGVQANAQARIAQRARTRATRRRYAWCGLAGLLLGGLVGHLAFDGIVPAALVGLGLGTVLGRSMGRRAA